MAVDNKLIKRDAAGQPIPQVYDPNIDDFQPALGTNGRQHTLVYNADGSPVDFAVLIANVIAALSAQGQGTPSEPTWVRLAGNSLAIEAIEITTSAQALSSLLTSPKPDRSFVEFQCTSANTVAVGSSDDVTTTTGYLVGPSERGPWRIPLSIANDLWLVASANTTIIVVQG